jgi:hypothetical protein
MTDEQKAALASTLCRIPVQSLNPSYAGQSRVSDGSFLRFHLPADDGKWRTVEVSNLLQADLLSLTQAIDAILPEKHRLNYRQAIESVD